MCGFIQFPDLKNAFNYWQDWSERQEQQKRQQKPILLWPLPAWLSTVQERYHNWPFGALNIYKHFPAHSPFFPFNTNIHSLTAVLPKKFLLRNRFFKKAKWGPTLHFTHRRCVAEALSREDLKCTFRFPEPKYFAPGSLNKEQGRGNKSFSQSWWQTITPMINEEWQVLLQTRHPHTSVITQALLVTSVNVCVWPWNLVMPWTRAKRTSKRLFTFISQMFSNADPTGTTPCSHLLVMWTRTAWVQENCRKSMLPGRRRWVSPSLTISKVVSPQIKTAPLLMSLRDFPSKRLSPLVL